MLFKSRYKESFTNKINKYLWPKKGWKRSGKYLSLRIRRLPGTPHGIALGFAFGVAMSMTPVVGAHLVFALLLSWVFGGSLTSTLIGTFIGNPWTFPVIWAVTYKIGYFIVPSDTLESVNLVSISNELSLLGKNKIDKKNVVDTLELARDKFPGSSISLDALCKRYRIDNSKRTKHTALIDCESVSYTHLTLPTNREV